ncbi:hypothetical protein [Stenotrophomonas phage RAS14]
MYPILIMCIGAAKVWHTNNQGEGAHCFHNRYPADLPDPDHVRLLCANYVRTQAWEALKIGNRKLQKYGNGTRVRWRWALEPNQWGSGKLSGRNSYLELFTDQKGDETGSKPLVLLARYPICGADFKALPIHQRLAIELLFRKDCGGHDTE